MAGYFLIVWDIVRFSRREGILCQGRGSAANSAVCYCLGITAVDPIRMELLFERFLSEDRREPPDIDIDFAHRERERVLQYVYERYGREHAAMVCEQITYRGRSAVRDAARILGFSLEQGDALAGGQRSLQRAQHRRRACAPVIGIGKRGRSAAHRIRGSDTERASVGQTGPVHRVDKPDSRIAAHQARPGASASSRLICRSLNGAHRRHTFRSRIVAPPSAPPPPTSMRTTVRTRIDKPELRKRYEREERLAAIPAVRARRILPAERATIDLSGYVGKSTDTEGTENSERSVTSALSVSSESHAVAVAGAGEKPAIHNASLDTHSPASPPYSPPAGTVERTDILERAGLDPKDVTCPRTGGYRGRTASTATRHRSIHVGGFVLTREPLSTVVPIEPASMPGRTVIQWERDDLDAASLVKIDLLGLGMLTVLQDCLVYVRHTRGVTIDLALLDTSDQAVYDDLCAADTIGVFQVESRAQMNTLPRLKPRSLLRYRRRSRAYPPWTDSGCDGASVSAAPRRCGGSGLSASVA